MESKKFKLVIFDWSGVIADTFDNWYVCAMEVFRVFGAPPLSREVARKEFRQPYMAFYNKFLPNISHADQSRVYVEAIQKCPPPRIFNGMREIFDVLRHNGIPMVIISGDSKMSLLAEVKRFGIEEYFQKILHDVYDKTETVIHMIRTHTLQPSEAIFVGDSMHEIEVGKIAGCRTCAVTWGFVSKEKLQLLKPDYIANTPKELQHIIL